MRQWAGHYGVTWPVVEALRPGMGTLMNRQMGQMVMEVTILLGSKSDMPVAEKCTKILEMFEVTYQLRAPPTAPLPLWSPSSRTPRRIARFIAMAGLAAAPGAVAALTTKPVIGVPCGGRVPYDSSSPSCSCSVPAATVGVDRGDNAGHLATQILAIADPAHVARLAQNKLDQVERVKAMDREVNGELTVRRRGVHLRGGRDPQATNRRHCHHRMLRWR